MARYRTIVAFLIAPLPIPILLSAFLIALDYADKSINPSFIDFLEGIAFFSIFALPQKRVVGTLLFVRQEFALIENPASRRQASPPS
jgi:hypothetical protein